MATLRNGTTILTSNDLNLNFEATFTDDVTPFSVAVRQDFLDLTKLKLSLTRYTDDQQDQDRFADGPPRKSAKSVADFWTTNYDWRAVEAGINSSFLHFTTIIQTPVTAIHRYQDRVPLHFIHHRSSRADAIPLLFVHGWPGSFLEVEELLSPLTDPPNPANPAFHVVAPSIPGYGFSPPPRKKDFGYRQAGATFRALMLKLGYDRYVFQCGDAGDLINRYAAVDFPENVISGVSNFWITPPRPDDLLRYAQGQVSDDERYLINLYQCFTKEHWAYGQLQQTRPLRLAVGLTDSPVGLAMWIYDGVRTGVTDTKIWTPERIITWTMMHWINGPYGAFSLYKNGAKVSDSPGVLPSSSTCTGRLMLCLAPYHRMAPSLLAGSTSCHMSISLLRSLSSRTTSGTEPRLTGQDDKETLCIGLCTTEAGISLAWMLLICSLMTFGSFLVIENFRIRRSSSTLSNDQELLLVVNTSTIETSWLGADIRDVLSRP
jgi:pimeloyl-ACP methyl ester carboxylesterase